MVLHDSELDEMWRLIQDIRGSVQMRCRVWVVKGDKQLGGKAKHGTIKQTDSHRPSL